MPIWGQAELLCRAVSEEGRREAEKVLSRAREEAEQIIASARERIERQYEAGILSKRAGDRDEAKRMIDSAELEAKRRIMTFREETMRELFGALEDRMRRFQNGPLYSGFLMTALAEGIERLGGKEFIVELNGGDLENFEDKIREFAGRFSLIIELTPSPSLEGGIRVFTRDRGRLYDNSLSARLKRMQNDIRQEIWREILGTDRNEL